LAPRRGNGGWDVADALELYNVPAWGSGYFTINEAGNVVVRPDTTAAHEIDLLEVVQGLQARDLAAPVVVRFSDILAHRLRHLHDAFARAITENEYRNRYAAVFPIKVNHQRLVVDEGYRSGREFGSRPRRWVSKPELAVMAVTESASDRLIICNASRTRATSRQSFSPRARRTIIPVRKFSTSWPSASRATPPPTGAPRIGVRVKLASEVRRWRDSAAEIQVRAVRHRDPGPAGDAARQ
jgi:arginine decarboxylase